MIQSSASPPRHAPLVRSVRPARVALMHDWLTSQRGGEQVLRALAHLFDRADIFTLVHRPGQVHADLERHQIKQSVLGRVPGLRSVFRAALPLFPLALRSLDVGAYDVVISSSHCVAHGIRTRPDAFHLAYVHSPMRYLYDQMHHYLPALGQRLCLPVAKVLSTPLRLWDRRAGARADVVLANSRYVAARIERVWGRTARVLHPPVDVAYFAAAQVPAKPSGEGRTNLVSVGALVPYKRTDLAVRLANRLRLPLTVVGQGPEEAALRRLAGPTVTFRRGLSRAQLRDLYAGALALVYAGEEDFGIVPIEAMAAGCPILALGRGGLAETVVGQGPHATGVLVADATVDALAQGLQLLQERLARGMLAPATLAAHVQAFSPAAFARGILREVEPALAARGLVLG